MFPVSARAVQKMMGNHTEKAGVKKIRVHDLRHSHVAYLIHEGVEQIADFMRQLYEYFYLKKNEIKKAQKNIPSDILKSFGELEKSEDIFHELKKTVLS